MALENWYEFIPSGIQGMDLARDMLWIWEQLYRQVICDERDYPHLHRILHNYGKMNRMAKKADVNQQPSTPNTGKFHWQTIELTSEDKATLASIDWSTDDLLDGLAELVRDGYSVSIKFDGYSGSIACHVTCNTPQHRDNGFGFTGYGTVLSDAVRVALYKYSYLAKGTISTYQAVPDRFR